MTVGGKEKRSKIDARLPDGGVTTATAPSIESLRRAGRPRISLSLGEGDRRRPFDVFLLEVRRMKFLAERGVRTEVRTANIRVLAADGVTGGRMTSFKSFESQRRLAKNQR